MNKLDNASQSTLEERLKELDSQIAHCQQRVATARFLGSLTMVEDYTDELRRLVVRRAAVLKNLPNGC